MLWVKTFHIFSMVCWFAGIFYLPRLFVYHSMATDDVSKERFKVMERKLFWGIMTPNAILTLMFGMWLMAGYGITGKWLSYKLILVALVIAYHIWCFITLNNFKHERSIKSHVYYRIMNEVPVFLLFGIIALVVVGRHYFY